MLKSRNVPCEESASSRCQSLRIRIKFQMSEEEAMFKRKVCVAVLDDSSEALRQAKTKQTLIQNTVLARTKFEDESSWRNRQAVNHYGAKKVSFR